MNYLNGWKTYCASAALFLFAAYGLASGHLDSVTAWPLLLQALAIAGLRNAIQ